MVVEEEMEEHDAAKEEMAAVGVVAEAAMEVEAEAAVEVEGEAASVEIEGEAVISGITMQGRSRSLPSVSVEGGETEVEQAGQAVRCDGARGGGAAAAAAAAIAERGMKRGKQEWFSAARMPFIVLNKVSHLLSYLRTCLLACLLTCLLACLLAYLLAYLLACLLACLLAYLSTYLLVGRLTSGSAPQIGMQSPPCRSLRPQSHCHWTPRMSTRCSSS